MDELIFTPAAVLDLLSSIEELKDYDINFNETESGITLSIGDSQYEISSNDAEVVEVPEEVVEEVAEINEDNYEPYISEEDDEAIEGGLIKELLKTLAVGGLVRLTKKAIEKA